MEHIQPKHDNRYPELIGRWDNFLLACVNCNSTKKDKDVVLADILLPDRDNTMAAFDYLEDGTIQVASTLLPISQTMAKKTLGLPGLDKPIIATYDAAGKLVATDRVGQRMETWLAAEEGKSELDSQPSEVMRRMVVKWAKAQGFFSIWMTVFSDDAVMRKMLIEGFEGTSQDCFDAVSTDLVTPRPANGLPDGGKC